MRGWLLARLAGLAVEDVVIPMAAAKTPAISQLSPNGLVPYLEHGEVRVWDSLAIAEYCAEISPALWPADRAARAHARAIAAEMHAGFGELRRAMPMNLGRDRPGIGQTPGALADIARVVELWADARKHFGGLFLFGDTFTAADAFYAPVAARFLTYQPPLPPAARDYCARVRAHPLVATWYQLAAEEPASWLLDKYESIA